MAHPARADMAEALAKQFDAWVTWDRIGSRWDTGRRAWLSLAASPDPWSLVLQDDAVPVLNFETGLRRAMKHVPPDSPLVLYAGRTREWAPRFGRIPRGVSFLVMDRIWWGPGIVLPTHLIEKAVHAGDQLDGDQYDHMLSAYFEQNHIPVYYTWPSLVDHAPGPSLVEGRVAGRRAHRVARNGRTERYDGKTHRISVT